MKLDKNNIKQGMILISFTIVLLTLMLNIQSMIQLFYTCISVIYPFILGGCIAFILNIPMNFYENKLFKIKTKLSRTISLVLSLLSVMIVCNVVIFIVVPELITTISTLPSTMSHFFDGVRQFLESSFDSPLIVNYIESLNWDSIFNELIVLIQSGASNILSSSLSITTSIVSFVVTFLVAIIFSIYILLQKETLSRQFKKVLYALFNQKWVLKFYEVSSLSYTTFCNFIAGQCLEAIILGFMFFVVMILLNMPYALLVGVLLCVTALIPIVGAFIGCFVGTFLIFIQDPMQAFVFLIVFLIIQQVEGNLIYPYVVGNSVGLPSIWVLVSVTVGGSLFGIVGMLVAIPIVSVLYTLFKNYVHTTLINKKISMEDL